MKHKLAIAVAGVSAALTLAGGTSAMAGNAPVSPAHTPTWHVAGPTPRGAITAVVATGRTTGWAFNGATALERTGATTWKKVAVLSKYGPVEVAGASSPSNVWAFVNDEFGRAEAYRWNGTKWSQVRTFTGWVGAVSVLGRGDVWVFGAPAYGNVPDQPYTGVWHYNGRAWTQVAKTVSGGDARTDTDVWAFTGTKIAHYNGVEWTAADVARLLPAKSPRVTGVIALGAGDAYALGSGGPKPSLVLLRYNGHSWSKAASASAFFGGGLSPDARGGLWLTVVNAKTRLPAMLHYTGGRLTGVTLPGDTVQPSFVDAISRVPGTAEQLAGGYVYAVDGSGKVYAQILQYS